LIEWKRKVVVLEEREQEIRERIKVQTDLNIKVEDYSMNIEAQIREADA
jgi:hypothetical protein